MQKFAPKFLSSKVSVIGLFASLILVLSVPVLILLSQQRQDVRSKASELSPTPQKQTTNARAISGYVYHDDNKDGEREPEEKAFPGVTVRIKQIQDPGVVGSQTQVATNLDILTDSNGYFRYHFPPNQNASTSYSVKVILPEKYKTITTNPVIIADITQNMQQIIEFGLLPIDGIAIPTPIVSVSPIPIQSGPSSLRKTGTQSGPTIAQQRALQIRPIQGK